MSAIRLKGDWSVSTIAPIKRGLKGVGPGAGVGAGAVSTIAPIKRGLKGYNRNLAVHL